MNEFPPNNKKIVIFNKSIRIHYMHHWQFIGEMSRKGEWHIFALDRFRFNERIRNVEPKISRILDIDHRHNIYTKYILPHNNNEND